MPNQTGPTTQQGKAVTRYNAASHGIYSVTPVLPKIERQSEWLAHRARVFADVAPDGYLQEIIAERIALNTWRLRRLEREQVRNRQRGFMDNLKLIAMYEHRELQKQRLDKDLDRLDRWSEDALIPNEKELMLLMRGACPEQSRAQAADAEGRAASRATSAWTCSTSSTCSGSGAKASLSYVSTRSLS
jgi:hypothetical protein